MKNRYFMLAALCAALSLLQACGQGEARPQVAETRTAPLPVAIVQPVIGDISAHYRATTTLEAEAEAMVNARVAGEITRILVEEGQFVTAGTVLAELDGQRLRLDARKARAELDKLRQEYRRLQELHEKGLVAAVDFDQLRFSLQSLEAAYELAQLQYGYTQVTAPINGVVSARLIKTGQTVVSGDQMFQITDPSRLVADLEIPQTEMGKFMQGQQAHLAFDALPGVTRTALVERISPTVDRQSGTFRVRLALSPKPGDLAAGMFARVRLAYEQHEGVMLIPSSAVISEDERAVIYVIEDGVAQRREIQTGLSDAGLTEVVGGLSASETVVATGAGALRDGAQVIAALERTVNAG